MNRYLAIKVWSDTGNAYTQTTKSQGMCVEDLDGLRNAG
jgi:hypothetical protein